MLEEGIVAYLTTITVLTAIQADRIYPGLLPQEPTLPATTFHRISGVPSYSQSGPSGFENVRIQFDCWAIDPLSAQRVAQALMQAISGFKGMMGNEAIGGCFITNVIDDLDDETGLYRMIVDAEFEHEIGN